MNRDPLAFEKRVKVFVSSRMTELSAERHAVKETVIEMGLVPVLFEDLNPKTRPSEEVYLDGVRRSQIYLALFHCEYASHEGPKMSATEQEYREARRLNLPRLVLVKPCAPGKRDPRLSKLLTGIGDGRRGVVYKPFCDLHELKNIVRDAVAEILSEHYQAPPKRHYDDLIEPALALLRERVWIDREAVREVRALLQRHARVLVYGSLGQGKTFLATRLAEELRAIYLPLVGRPVASALGYLCHQLRHRQGLPPAEYSSMEDLQISLDLALQNSEELIVIDGLDANPDTTAHLSRLDYYANRLLLTSRHSETGEFGSVTSPLTH